MKKLRDLNLKIKLIWGGMAMVLIPMLLAQFAAFLAGFMPLFISIPVSVALGVGLALYNSAVVPVSYVVIREYVDGLDPAQLLGRRR